jgi:hypothetical protein
MEQDKLFMEGALVEGSADRDKREVIIDLIAEGFGNKRDNHYYGRDILEAAAADFAGTKQYVDHLDPETVRKLNGMPRSVRDLAGRIVEAWIDTNAEGKTVIRGRAKIAQPWLWELVENDPDLLGVSINAWGKSKPGTDAGRQARIVEGISKIGSVDWVTEAGAGGKVVSLVEAQLEEEEGVDEAKTVSDLTADTLLEERPDLVEELLAQFREEAAEEDGGDQNGAVVEPGGATAKDNDGTEGDEPTERGSESDDDEDGEAQQEGNAECPHCGKGILIEADENIEEAAQELAREKLEEAVAAAIEVVRENFEQQLLEQQAEFDRELGLRDQRILSARLIEKAGFKSPTEKALKEEFFDSYFEGEYDDEGNEVKSPEAQLSEAVTARIEEKRNELSAYSEARVTGAGETADLQESRKRPKVAPTDQNIDRFLGIAKDD